MRTCGDWLDEFLVYFPKRRKPMYFQTTARLANGDYLMHISQFSDLNLSIDAARGWHARKQSKKSGSYAIVRDHLGTLVFDSRGPHNHTVYCIDASGRCRVTGEV